MREARPITPPWSTTPSATHPAILLMLLFAASQPDPEPEAPPDCLLIPCLEPEAPPDCLLIPGPEPEAPPDCLLVEFLATLASAAYRSHVCIPHTLKGKDIMIQGLRVWELMV